MADDERIAGPPEIEQQLQFGSAAAASSARLLGADYLAAAVSSAAHWIERSKVETRASP